MQKSCYYEPHLSKSGLNKYWSPLLFFARIKSSKEISGSHDDGLITAWKLIFIQLSTDPLSCLNLLHESRRSFIYKITNNHSLLPVFCFFVECKWRCQIIWWSIWVLQNWIKVYCILPIVIVLYTNFHDFTFIRIIH